MKAYLQFAAAIAVALPSSAQAQIIEGTATAIDGDTLDMTGQRIRLLHIDAPELRQTCQRASEWTCGAEAKAALSGLVANEPVVCTATGLDAYRRYLATCRTRHGDLAQALLRQGMATVDDNAPYEYAAAASEALAAKRGIWGSTFEEPADWRAANAPKPKPRSKLARQQRQAEQRYTDRWGCAIKGNRSQRGEWIYHMPGQRYYAQTRPEELFCSESEARAAGYRRSKI